MVYMLNRKVVAENTIKLNNQRTSIAKLSLLLFVLNLASCNIPNPVLPPVTNDENTGNTDATDTRGVIKFSAMGAGASTRSLSLESIISDSELEVFQNTTPDTSVEMINLFLENYEPLQGKIVNVYRIPSIVVEEMKTQLLSYNLEITAKDVFDLFQISNVNQGYIERALVWKNEGVITPAEFRNITEDGASWRSFGENTYNSKKGGFLTGSIAKQNLTRMAQRVFTSATRVNSQFLDRETGVEDNLGITIAQKSNFLFRLEVTGDEANTYIVSVQVAEEDIDTLRYLIGAYIRL